MSPKEKEWHNQFTKEFIHADFRKKRVKDKNLHKTKDLEKDCYHKNNSRNRDILTRAKITGSLVYTDDRFYNLPDLDNLNQNSTEFAYQKSFENSAANNLMLKEFMDQLVLFDYVNNKDEIIKDLMERLDIGDDPKVIEQILDRLYDTYNGVDNT